MIRPATEADLPRLKELYDEFELALPGPEWWKESFEEQREGIERDVRAGTLLLAERDGAIVGLCDVQIGERVGWIESLFVREGERGRGLGRKLFAAAASLLRERGLDRVGLEVDDANPRARALYDRLGFRPLSASLAVSLDELESRLAGPEEGPGYGSVHIQTDDRSAVERAVAQFVPRLGRSAGTRVEGPRSGWVAVYDELADREPKALRRLARELSDRLGAVVLQLGLEQGAVVRYVLFDRGRVADEYASVPEFHGPLPPGDVVALAANPTVAQRLTGAEPSRLRAVARTAASPAELPPAAELLAAVARALGVEGGDRGYGP